MSRDHNKLKVFRQSDELVVDLYRSTQGFPPEERYGIQAQRRRAAVSVPTNLVEGCTRRSTKDYLHFITIALGSASEVCYLLSLARRLEVMPTQVSERLETSYTALVHGLQKLVNALDERS